MGEISGLDVTVWVVGCVDILRKGMAELTLRCFLAFFFVSVDS